MSTPINVSVSAPSPSLVVGGRVFTDLTNLITLFGSCNGSARVWTQLGDFNGPYQVTAGKTLYLSAAEVTVRVVDGSSTTVDLSIGYGDVAAGLQATTQPTGAVYVGGDDGNSASQFPVNAVGQIQYGFSPLRIPSGKFPFCTDSANATNIKLFFWVCGYEI